MNTMVYGNVALAPVERYETPRVIPGGKRDVYSVAVRQLGAPDVYAKIRPRTASTSSVVRAVIGVCTIAVIAVALLVGSNQAQAARYASAMAEVSQVDLSVAAGDSLWSIAQSCEVDGLSTAEVVDLIREWNDMDGSMLHPGMTLSVPRAH